MDGWMGKEATDRRKGERNLKVISRAEKEETATNKPIPRHASHGCRLERMHLHMHAGTHIHK